MFIVFILPILVVVGWVGCQPIIPSYAPRYQLVYLTPPYHVNLHPQERIIPQILHNRVTNDNQRDDSVETNAEDGKYEVSQFHSEDANGRVVFGFHSPDQIRMETRDIDGSVRGSYSYIDPNGNIVKMQYWDDGSGFHAAGNNIPVAIHQAPEFTPEVKAAREQHLRLYEAALSALKAAADSQENEKDDASYIDTSHYEGGDEYEDAPPEGGVIIENPAPPSSVYADSLLSAEYPKLQHNQNNHINDNSYYSDEDKESVSVENPELRRRLLLRKDKEQDNNDSTKNKEHEPSSESDKDQASASVDENGSNKQSSEQSANGRAFYYHFTHTIPKPVERVDLSEETKHVAEPLSQSAKAQHYGSIPVAGVHDVQLSPAQRNALSNFQLYPVYHSQQN